MPEVNRRLALELNGLTDQYPSPVGADPMAGQRVPALEIQRTTGIVPVGELLRSGHLLVLDLTGDDRLADLTFRSAPVDVVSGVPVRLPHSLRTATTLLVRPDSYLAWVGRGKHDAPSVRDEIERLLDRAERPLPCLGGHALHPGQYFGGLPSS